MWGSNNKKNSEKKTEIDIQKWGKERDKKEKKSAPNVSMVYFSMNKLNSFMQRICN